MNKVYFPAYTSNTGALSALFSNQIDWTGNYIPGLQKQFVDPSPATHHFWEAAGGDESLEPNLTKWPTSQLAVRQAISLAVNRTLLASEGEAGLENPETNSTGLTQPTFSAWGAPVANMTFSSTSNMAAAKSILEKAGCHARQQRLLPARRQDRRGHDHQPLGIHRHGSGRRARRAGNEGGGIDATFEGLSVNAWNADVADGDFSMTEHWSNGGITPFNMYNGWLNSSLSSGSAATGDFERLNSPAMDADLTKLGADSTVAQQTADLVPIEQYVAANLPVIPVTTAADWFEYNSGTYHRLADPDEPV